MSWFGRLGLGKKSSPSQSTPEPDVAELVPDQPRSRAPVSSPRKALSPEALAQIDKLKGMWTVYTNMRGDVERNQQMHKILPLFNQIYKDADLGIINDTLGDTKKFTFAVARKLVKEIRTDWKSNQPPESNAISIIKLLANSDPKDEEKSGKELLTALEIVMVGAANVEVATEASISSTFVKVLQLLFQLPIATAERYRRYKTEERIVKLLIYMCNFRCSVSEMIKTDTLILLFHMTTVACSPHREILRECVLGVVSIILKYHIDAETIDYLKKRTAVRFQIIHVREQLNTIRPDQILLIWNSIAEALRESSKISSALCDEFEEAQGYQLLLDTMLRLESMFIQIQSASEEEKALARQENHTAEVLRHRLIQLMDLCAELVYSGKDELVPPASISPYNNPVLETIGTGDFSTKVRNPSAFQVLQNFFLQGKDNGIRLRVLDSILGVYAAHYLNFLLLQHLHTLAHFIEAFEKLPFELKEGVLRVLVFVVTVISYVPFQEISSLSCLLQENPSSATVVLIFQTVTKLVNFDRKYKAIFQEAGLLHMLLVLLKRFYSSVTTIHPNDVVTFLEPSTADVSSGSPTSHENLVNNAGVGDTSPIATYTVSMDCITLLLDKQPENIRIFRESGCTDILFALIHHVEMRPAALRVLQVLLEQDSNNNAGDMIGLMEIMQAAPTVSFEMKKDILSTLRRCLIASDKVKDLFREFGGFVCCISLLISLEHPDSSSASTKVGNINSLSDNEAISAKTDLVESIFVTIATAIHHHEKNRKFFKEQIVCTLSGALKLTGILSTIQGYKVLEGLLNISVERISCNELINPEDVEIQNPEVMNVILELFPFSSSEVRVAIMKQIVNITRNRKRNQDALCSVKLLEFIEDHLTAELLNEGDLLHPYLLSFFEVLAKHRITTVELRKFIRLLDPERALSPKLLGSLLRVAQSGIEPPHVELDLRRTGNACIHLPSFGSRSWPPNGYTFLAWVYFEVMGPAIDLFSFEADDRRSVSSLVISNGRVLFETTNKAGNAEFIFPFEVGKWYHIGLVHSRSRFQSSEARLYVNGVCRGVAKAAFASTPVGNVSAFLGTPPGRRLPADQVWKLGPCYLIEEVLGPEKMLSCFCLGTTYCSHFQGNFGAYQTYEVINSENLSVVQRLLDLGSPLGPLDLGSSSFVIPEDRIIFALNGYNTHRIAAGSDSVASSVSLSSSTLSGKGDEGGVVIINSVDPKGVTSRAFLTGGSISLAASGIAHVMERIGGVDVALMFLEAASTAEMLEDAFSLVLCLIRHNPRCTTQMEWTRGYEKVACLLCSKSHLISERLLDCVLNLVGLVVPKDQDPVISNIFAFRYLIADYELWKQTSLALQLKLFKNLQKLLVHNGQAVFNAFQMRRMNLIPRFLSMLQDDAIADELLELIVDIVRSLVSLQLEEQDLHFLSAFLVNTLVNPTNKKVQYQQQQGSSMLASGSNEELQLGRKTPIIRRRMRSTSRKAGGSTPASSESVERSIKARNYILNLIFDLLEKSPEHKGFSRVLTPNWIFFFIEPGTDAQSVITAMKILVTLFKANKQQFCQRFRSLEGFKILERMLPSYYQQYKIYYLLICLLLGKPLDIIPENPSMIFSDLFTVFKSPTRELHCTEALHVLLCVLKRCCEGSIPSSTHTYVNKNLPGLNLGKPEELVNLDIDVAAPLSGIESENDASANTQTVQLGTTLLRWQVTDQELAIQKAIIPFLLHLFNSTSDLQETIYTDKKGDLLEYIVSCLFPYGHLNFPPSRNSEPEKGKGTSNINKRIQDPDPDRDLDNFNCHHSSELLFLFLRDILFSAMLHSSKTASVSVHELVSEGVPINVSEAQFVLYQSKLISDLIEELKSKMSKRMFAESSKFASNLAKFCTFVVDKVCFGLYPHGGTGVFDFLIELIERLEDGNSKQSGGSVMFSSSGSLVGRVVGSSNKSSNVKNKTDLGLIYRSMNRLIIHLLGVPYGKTRTDFLHIIQKIVFHQRIVLSLNTDEDFFLSLCYVLYKFLLDDNKKLREGSMNVWKLLLLTKPEVMSHILIHKPPKSSTPTIDLLTNGFDMLLHKDFKEFSFWLGDAMQQIHTVFDEHLSKEFLANKEAERKAKIEHLKHLKARRAHRIHKKEKKDRQTVSHLTKITTWRNQTINLIQENSLRRVRRWKQESIERQKYVLSLWSTSRKALLRERGVWGPLVPSPLDKWQLDMTEGLFRMRKKLKRNFNFYLHYPYIPEGITQGEDNLEKIPTSYDSRLYYEQLEKARAAGPSSSAILSSRDASVLLSPSPLAMVTTSGNSDRVLVSNSGVSVASSKGDSRNNVNKQQLTVNQILLEDESGDSDFPVTPLLPTSLPSLEIKEDELSPDRTGSGFSLDFPGSPSGKERSLDQYIEEMVGPETPRGQHSASSSSTTSTSPGDASLPKTSDSDVDSEFTGEDLSSDSEEEHIEEAEEFLEEEDYKDQQDDQISRILEPGDRVEGQYNSGRVEGQDKRDGIFIIGTNYFYFIDDYVLSSEGDVIEIFHMSHTPVGTIPIQKSPTRGVPVDQKTKTKHRVHKWAFEDCRDILRRRYLLQPVAVEIFSNDGRNVFFVFSKDAREDVFKQLSNKITASNEVIDSIGGIPTAVFPANENAGNSRLDAVKSIMWKSKETMCQKWIKGEISNFQYLMYINTLAGRSYNDLTQYPVFPWVLSDYHSVELDLTDPGVYRDLSKPMGALNEGRAKEFEARYENWEPDENMGVPKFHYGTHYSSAGHVLYYLIRLEPFSQQFLALQSGRFDVADRLFHSINETWMSSSGATLNLADVKELIPEFFYLPEMFMNNNRFEFGKKQSGERLDHVELPAWAKGDPQEFVRLNRAALESDYVSMHLHEWIDLIFGHKQQGPAAVEALNVFYYLTYEGAVDIDSIPDPIEKESTIAQINNFGQTPTQLFKKPHPRREVCYSPYPCLSVSGITVCKPPCILDVITSQSLSQKVVVTKEDEAIGSIRSNGLGMQIITGPTKRVLPSKSSSTRHIQWGFMDFTIRIISEAGGDAIAVLEDAHEGQINSLCTSDDGRIVVTGGADSLVCVHRIHNGSEFQTPTVRLVGHLEAISCVEVSRSYSIIVSGSVDGLCIVWDLNKLCFVRALHRPEGVPANRPVSMIYTDEISGNIITCCGRFMNVWSINGVLLVSKRMHTTITSVSCSQGYDYLDECHIYVTGHDDGNICAWRWGWEGKNRDLKLKEKFKAHNTAVTALFITNDQKVLYSGDAAGKVIEWKEEIVQNK